jgi:hypothetical protein
MTRREEVTTQKSLRLIIKDNDCITTPRACAISSRPTIDRSRRGAFNSAVIRVFQDSESGCRAQRVLTHPQEGPSPSMKTSFVIILLIGSLKTQPRL